MDKIYSRPRLLLPKIKFNRFNKSHGNRFNNYNNKNNKIKRKVSTIVVVLIIAFATVFKMLDSIDGIVDKQCETGAKSIATRISNEQATAVMTKYKYEDLFNTQKDANRECFSN